MTQTSLDIIGRQIQTAAPIDEHNEDTLDKIKDLIGGFSLLGPNGVGLSPYPMAKGENDYSNWRAELRRMSPEIEETLTSIWRIAGAMTPTETALARFEAKMCRDEVFAPCHQRIRQKRFLVKRQMLATEAIMTYLDGAGEPWQMPEDIWENLHEMDPDFQDAIMDLHWVGSPDTNRKALNIWLDAADRINTINLSIQRDRQKGIFKDYSQTIDALLRTNPDRADETYNALIQNTDAYW